MASGQTIIEYGTICRLFNCTTRVEQQPVFDASGTDLACWRFVIHATGYIHGRGSSNGNWAKYHVSGPGTGQISDTGTASANHKAFRFQLPPRQSFRMRVGCASVSDGTGNILIEAHAMLGAVSVPADLTSNSAIAGVTSGAQGLSQYDVKDGPKCLQFDVVHVTADEVYRVEAVFEVYKVECDSLAEAHGNTTGVLSHRWSCNDDLDSNMRTYRTYSGLLELATSVFSPHWFRYLVIPPLAPGMRRDSMRFSATEDGKKLQYSITDVEVHTSAPKPCTKWSIVHSEGAHWGQSGFGTIDVSLEADSNANKGELISIALKVIQQMLTAKIVAGVRTALAADQYTLEDIVITDHIGDVNMLTARATVKRIGVTTDNFANFAGGQLGIAIMDADLPAFVVNYDRQTSRGGRNGEKPEYQGPISLTSIFRAYLQSPCDTAHGINNGNMLENDLNGAVAQVPNVTVQAEIVPTLTTADVDYYSTSHTTAMYKNYQMESLYDQNQMCAAMPIASSGYGGSGAAPATCKVVTLSQPQTTRTARIVAERVGEQPEFPDPANFNEIVGASLGTIVAKLLRVKRLGCTRTYTATGQELYRARFEAKYALERTPEADDELPVGVNKWTNDGVETTNSTLTGSSGGF